MHRTACVLTALLLGACIPTGDDDDDDATCEGSMDWVFNGAADAGADGATCALIQGTDFITINTSNADGSADWQITFSAFTGVGTHDIVERGDWNITGHADGESWWATAGSFTIDTWADPQLAGSFDTSGSNADDSLVMTVSGTFDVTVAPYVE